MHTNTHSGFLQTPLPLSWRENVEYTRNATNRFDINEICGLYRSSLQTWVRVCVCSTLNLQLWPSSSQGVNGISGLCVDETCMCVCMCIHVPTATPQPWRYDITLLLHKMYVYIHMYVLRCILTKYIGVSVCMFVCLHVCTHPDCEC